MKYKQCFSIPLLGTLLFNSFDTKGKSRGTTGMHDEEGSVLESCFGTHILCKLIVYHVIFLSITVLEWIQVYTAVVKVVVIKLLSFRSKQTLLSPRRQSCIVPLCPSHINPITSSTSLVLPSTGRQLAEEGLDGDGFPSGGDRVDS